MAAKTKFELKPGAATREAFGKALVELGRSNPAVVVLDADLSKSTYTAGFAKGVSGPILRMRDRGGEHGRHRSRFGFGREDSLRFKLFGFPPQQGI
jgi:hypothetical protein